MIFSLSVPSFRPFEDTENTDVVLQFFGGERFSFQRPEASPLSKTERELFSTFHRLQAERNKVSTTNLRRLAGVFLQPAAEAGTLDTFQQQPTMKKGRFLAAAQEEHPEEKEKKEHGALYDYTKTTLKVLSEEAEKHQLYKGTRLFGRLLNKVFPKAHYYALVHYIRTEGYVEGTMIFLNGLVGAKAGHKAGALLAKKCLTTASAEYCLFVAKQVLGSACPQVATITHVVSFIMAVKTCVEATHFAHHVIVPVTAKPTRKFLEPVITTLEKLHP